MSSSWGTKFEKKLKALADKASKESQQTLARWVAFNRKHAAAFAPVLLKELQATNDNKAATRNALYWQVVHEILMAQNEDADKWERTLDMRLTLGEQALLPALASSTTAERAQQLQSDFVSQWEDANVFSGPTLMGQIKRAISANISGSALSASPQPSTDTASTSKDETESKQKEPMEKKTESAKEQEDETTKDLDQNKSLKSSDERRDSLASTGSAATQPTAARRDSLSSVTEVEYDFEAKNIPQANVDAREFLDPCKNLATLQIARDLNDSAAQLHSLLTNLPQDIQDEVQEITTSQSSPSDWDKAKIRDYSIRIPSELLKKNLEEEVLAIQVLKDIIQKQRAARERLIHLLIQSRCQFGSQDAAQLFYELQSTFDKLQAKQHKLRDALELEGGLDADGTQDEFNSPEEWEKAMEGLSPLTWYQTDESGNKRQRVE